MRQSISMLALIAISLSTVNLAYADQNSNSRLKGNYNFTGIYNCLDAPGGFNAAGQPLSPENSLAAYVVISGVMSFDGRGTSTQNGNFTENESPGAPSNTTAMPGVGSGTFTVADSPYTVAKDGSVTLTTGVLSFTGLTGVDVGISANITNNSGQLLGNLSRNGSLLLTTTAPLIQSVDLFIGGNYILTFPRQCSVTMTLTP